MGKTYLVRTELYYKITVSDEAKDEYIIEVDAARAALKTIHDYELYHINDKGLTQELKCLGCSIDKAEYYGIDYLTVRVVDDYDYKSLTEQLNNPLERNDNK